jgi:hypothetical protein
MGEAREEQGEEGEGKDGGGGGCVYYRDGKPLTRAHIWRDGFDMNQFAREWNYETGAFVDGHLPTWVPEEQEALFEAARHGEVSSSRLVSLQRQLFFSLATDLRELFLLQVKCPVVALPLCCNEEHSSTDTLRASTA